MIEKLFTKDFVLVVIGQIISLFGNAILRFSLPLYILKETGSAGLFGITIAVSFLPMIVLAFLGGVLADRVNKRNIMVILDFLTAFIIIFVYLTIKIVPIVPLIMITLMLLYGISGTYHPTVQASIPALVSKKNVIKATAIVNQINALANLIGPIFGGMLFGDFGIMAILFISIFCFLISAIMEIFIKIPFKKRNNKIGICAIVKEDFFGSVNYIKKEKPILFKIIIIAAIFNLFLASMFIVGIPILIVETLKMSYKLLGIAQGISAIGGLTGGITAAILSERLKISSLYKILLVCALSIAIMSIPIIFEMSIKIAYGVIILTNFLIMGIVTMCSVRVVAKIQIETPQELVGKIIALMIAISMCAQPIGQAIYGIIFEKFAQNIGFIFLGVSFVAGIISLATKKYLKE